MRFTGEVRIPDVDHPGVPATFVVEDDQTEVFLEGESLGRWSLFDVHASRLVSAAFSVQIGRDEITFIADEPVDFAYKGVEHMAEVWARFKAMTLPRRTVAVKRSRRGTHPSRIGELREAMLQNLAAGEQLALSPEELADPPHPAVAEPVADTPILDEAVGAAPTAEPLESEPAPPEDITVEPVPEQPPVLRPGPGLFARVEPEPVLEEPEPEPEPVLEQPEPEPEPVLEEPEPEPEPEPVVAASEAPIAEPDGEELIAEEPAASTEQVPEMVKELLGTSAGEAEGDAPRDLVVDLGEFEQGPGSAASPEPEEPAPDTDREPVMSTAAPEDKSGLFGAVRSAFVRNKASHVHEFVEAPGGIGLVRQICNECGYISIGVSD